MKQQSQLRTYPLTNAHNPVNSSSVPLQPLTLPQHSTQNPSQQISKNSSALTPHHNTLTSQRHQYILLQSQVRRLNKRIQIEQQIIKSKKMFQRIEEEIKVEEEKIKEKKRQIIKARIQNLEANKKKRQEKVNESDKVVAQIKAKQKKKQFLLKKILEKNKSEHDQCYQNALMQRKMILGRPINFQAIHSHEKKYLRQKNRYKTTFQQHENQGSEYTNEEDKDEKRHRYKANQSGSQSKSNSNRDRQKSLSLRYEGGNSQLSKRKKQAKSSMQQYLQTRRKQQKRIEQIKQLRQKSKQYGNRVQIQYHKSRSKTESIEYQKQQQKQQAEQKQKHLSEIDKILKNMKKPNIPQKFNKNIENRKKNELQKIIQSNQSPSEKMIKLNLMSEVEVNKFNRKHKIQDLERLNEIYEESRAVVVVGMKVGEGGRSFFFLFVALYFVIFMCLYRYVCRCRCRMDGVYIRLLTNKQIGIDNVGI